MDPNTALHQNDPRWKDRLLGFDNESTIGQFGCLLTSLAMVANRFGHRETPETLNDKMKAIQGFQGPFIRTGLIGNAVPGMRIKRSIQCRGQEAPLADVDSALAAGFPVVVEVDSSPAPGLQNHWVVLYAREGDDYLLLDPWHDPRKENTLLKRYRFDGQSPARLIQSAIWFEGSPAPAGPAPGPAPTQPAPAVAPPPRLPVPAGAPRLVVTGDGLALRSAPVISEANLRKRLRLGTELIALEPGAEARAGAEGAWLRVQDPAGEQGYVAAAYVSRRATAPEPPQPAAPAGPTAGALVVRPLVDGLALRREAVISEATLVKRLALTARLRVVEPRGPAEKKLGVKGEWLQVRDITGAAGFVAAWLATSADDPALGPRPAAADEKPDAPSRLVGLTTGEGVALRSAPRIADDTLRKRLPQAAELLVLGPSDAEQLIGQNGRWLQVRDLAGDEGYVAAWYVARA